MIPRAPKLLLPVVAAATLLAAGCDSNSDASGSAAGIDTGGGNVGGSDVGGFQLTSISVPNLAIWKINRPITFVFSSAVDFSTVNLNTISIRGENGLPASGVFTQDPIQPRIITFQPTCPIQADFSDAGFLPGGIKYRIQVLGKGSGVVVRSKEGKPLDAPQQRDFFTPASFELSTLFLDSIPGAPLPVVRTQGSTNLNATYVEVAGDDTIAKRIYFERFVNTMTMETETTVPGSGDGSIPTGHPLEMLETGMPLNLYSDQTSRLSFVIEMNQPVNPRPENIASDRVLIQAEDTLGSGAFTRIPSTVELIRNCTETGATVRVTPIGVLPQNVRIRLVVAAEFEDLAGDRHLAPILNFGRIQTRDVGSALAGDEVLEEFVLSAPSMGSFEDANAPFPEPRAIWANGQLRPRFDFDGTGGPGGSFDFRVPAGSTAIIDTTFAIVQNQTQTASQTIINGRFDVRNLIVETGGVLQFRGPNTASINAIGNVQIDGEIELNGFGGKDVAGINTASFPEPGAAGNLGGGKGGDASIEKTQSTPRGGDGNGPFGVPGIGGKGGETGFGADPSVNNQNSAQADPNFRKGAGGGGGVLGIEPNYIENGNDVFTNNPPNINNEGLNARPGGDGSSQATGAVFGAQPRGGAIGNSPFLDDIDTNNFFGVLFDSMTQEVTRGELERIIAGSGGGGGGDNTRSATFPNPDFSNSSEDKGGGGGGGAGGIRIRALGNVTFGPTGRLVANGGSGAKGQTIQFQSNFFTKAGAGGGGGSGGHIVIETAKQIDLGSGAEAIVARGGRGGEGKNNMAGGQAAAGGGVGGPGLIQLHAPAGASDILHTQEIQIAVAPIPEPYLTWSILDADPDNPNGGFIAANQAFPSDPTMITTQLVPSFGPVSRARSTWIPLGGAVGTLPTDVTFLFDGTDVTNGRVLDTMPADGVVDDLAPIIGPASLATGTTAPFLELDSDAGGPDRDTLVFDRASGASTMFAMADEIYEENPILMKNFVLLIRETANPVVVNERYNIASITVDPNDPDLMRVVPSLGEQPFQDILNAVGGDVTQLDFQVLPRFFKVSTAGVDDGLPASSTITIRFEGTFADPDGNPISDSATVIGPTGDIRELFDPPMGSPVTLTQPVEFFRFEVEFDIAAGATTLSANSPRPVLEFLRIPFQF